MDFITQYSTVYPAWPTAAPPGIYTAVGLVGHSTIFVQSGGYLLTKDGWKLTTELVVGNSFVALGPFPDMWVFAQHLKELGLSAVSYARPFVHFTQVTSIEDLTYPISPVVLTPPDILSPVLSPLNGGPAPVIPPTICAVALSPADSGLNFFPVTVT
jgi:hypothetical protein